MVEKEYRIEAVQKSGESQIPIIFRYNQPPLLPREREACVRAREKERNEREREGKGPP